MGNIIRKGAEANIYLENGLIVKERVKKSYRIEAIDEVLRKRRTKSEARLLEKAFEIGVSVPRVEALDKFSIRMQHISGCRLKDILDSKNAVSFGKGLGTMVGKLHKNNIIHGDLTTSNVILNESGLYLVDFGLGYISLAVEDKAVDLHLLEEALESTHFKLKDRFFDAFCESYKKENPKSGNIFERLEEIRQRGRYVER